MQATRFAANSSVVTSATELEACTAITLLPNGTRLVGVGSGDRARVLLFAPDTAEQMVEFVVEAPALDTVVDIAVFLNLAERQMMFAVATATCVEIWDCVNCTRKFVVDLNGGCRALTWSTAARLVVITGQGPALLEVGKKGWQAAFVASPEGMPELGLLCARTCRNKVAVLTEDALCVVDLTFSRTLERCRPPLRPARTWFG